MRAQGVCAVALRQSIAVTSGSVLASAASSAVPHTRYIAHGGRLMEFEKQEEVFHADRLKSLIKSAQRSLEIAQLQVAGKKVYAKAPRIYPRHRAAVSVQQLLDALHDGRSPNSPKLWRRRKTRS